MSLIRFSQESTVFDAVQSPVNLEESLSMRFFYKKFYVKNYALELT